MTAAAIPDGFDINSITDDDIKPFLLEALDLASNSSKLPTNFRVGALLIHWPTKSVLAKGYTNELPGNTHAEEVCFEKWNQENPGAAAQDKAQHPTNQSRPFPSSTILVTTMEPCIKRLSGKKSCVERILDTQIDLEEPSKEGRVGIEVVFSGVSEPETFVGENEGRAKLREKGVKCIYVKGLEEQILAVATAGHEKASR